MVGEELSRHQNSLSTAEIKINGMIRAEWVDMLFFYIAYMTSGKLPFSVWSFRNNLVGIGHHGNQEIQQDNNIDHRITSKHEQCPKSSKTLYPSQFKWNEIDQTKWCPKERLRCFKQTEIRINFIVNPCCWQESNWNKILCKASPSCTCFLIIIKVW